MHSNKLIFIILVLQIMFIALDMSPYIFIIWLPHNKAHRKFIAKVMLNANINTSASLINIYIYVYNDKEFCDNCFENNNFFLNT